MKAKRMGDTRQFDMKGGMLRCSSNLIPVWLFIFIFLAAFTRPAVGQSIPADQKSLKPIPVAEVPIRAMEVSDLLRTLKKQVSSGEEFVKLQQKFTDSIGEMTTDEQRAHTVLQSIPTLQMLQNEERIWQNNQDQMTTWSDFILKRLDRLQSGLKQLADLQKIWLLTLDSVNASNAPDKIIQQINEVILSIEAEQKIFGMEQGSAIDLHGRISEKVAQGTVVLAQIAKAQREAIGDIKRWGNKPIWSAELWDQARVEGVAQLRTISAAAWADIHFYLYDATSPIWKQLGFLLFLSLLIFSMKRAVNRWKAGEDVSFITTVIDHPFTTALIVTLMVFSSPYSSTPIVIKDFFEVLLLAMMILLIQPTLDRLLIIGLCSLLVLFTLDIVRSMFSSVFFFEQVLIVLEALLGISVLGWLLAYGNFRESFIQATGLKRFRVIQAGHNIILIALGIGLVAGITGYTMAAKLLVSGIVISGALALIIIGSVKILCSLVFFCLRIWPLNLLNMVRNYRDFLEKRFNHILIFLGVCGWLIRMLDYSGILQPILSAGGAVLDARLDRGSISISIGDVFAFILAIWISYLLSAAIRFILREDVYPRTNISRSISYTISRIIHYLVLLIGFLVGLGVFGIELSKLTVVFGALGVGIGFGLQSVVNNIVSGLILLFTRPINVDDTIEVGNIMGEIKQIGIRSSILRTRQGADIIIPNAELTGGQVINWTYSDKRRRIELPVGVNYSSEPRKVIEMITAVASAHPRVLRYPPPQTFLTEFGDSSINYELRVWTDDALNWYIIRSELAVAIYDAIHASGMVIPFPQREVRLLKDNEA